MSKCGFPNCKCINVLLTDERSLPGVVPRPMAYLRRTQHYRDHIAFSSTLLTENKGSKESDVSQHVTGSTRNIRHREKTQFHVPLAPCNQGLQLTLTSAALVVPTQHIYIYIYMIQCVLSTMVHKACNTRRSRLYTRRRHPCHHVEIANGECYA